VKSVMFTSSCSSCAKSVCRSSGEMIAIKIAARVPACLQVAGGSAASPFVYLSASHRCRDDIPFKFCERGEHVKHQFAGWCGGIDVLASGYVIGRLRCWP
jgi:hypothetical protein